MRPIESSKYLSLVQTKNSGLAKLIHACSGHSLNEPPKELDITKLVRRRLCQFNHNQDITKIFCQHICDEWRRHFAATGGPNRD